jgi:hypothetical protein
MAAPRFGEDLRRLDRTIFPTTVLRRPRGTERDDQASLLAQAG